ncbi:MAG: DUF1294 domain-containing protein [Oscillospiraceae bacterium]|nr:DUF1294 domain-containing protein [Oscillospiraceae bacterium]
MDGISIEIIGLIVWNFFTFCLYGIDKYKAKHNKWRISEKVLLLAAVLMGAVGALLGMYIFRHKTKHLAFKIGVPIILLINIAVVLVYTGKLPL